jgi:hypothetical protein
MLVHLNFIKDLFRDRTTSKNLTESLLFGNLETIHHPIRNTVLSIKTNTK